MIDVIPIKAFSDNYIWCLQQGTNCAVVDPGDAQPVLTYLSDNKLQLTDILITHHHADHIGGIETLKNKFPDVKIFGADSGRIPHVTDFVGEGDTISLSKLDCHLSVLALPGHTLDHIAYYNDSSLFCGDTLFSAGCGRLFEGTPSQMYHSLEKLKALPEHLKLYCTHEYTEANVQFALEAEPNNKKLVNYANWVKQQRSDAKPTLPGTLKIEKEINPFLRTTELGIINQLKQTLKITTDTPIEVFAALRGWKDNF